jgi:hypothetical protein
MASLEVTQSEMQELRHGVRAGLGAHSMALGLVYEDTQAIKAELHDFRVETRERFTGIEERFTAVEATLAEILRRLPS